MKNPLKRLMCLVGAHDWTSKAMEGLKPDAISPDITKEELYKSFEEYATMYCKVCGKVSKFNDVLKR